MSLPPSSIPSPSLPPSPPTDPLPLYGLPSSLLPAENPLFSAGLGLLGLTASLAFLRRGLVLASTAVRRRMLVSLEIPSKDRAYPWFLHWLSLSSSASASPSASGPAIKLYSHDYSVQTTHQLRPNGTPEASFALVPGPGTHYFRYQRAWFRLTRSRDSKLLDHASGSAPWETLIILTLRRDAALLTKLLDHARQLALQNVAGKTVIYTAWGAEWRPFGAPRAQRDLASVVLARNIKQTVVDDIRAFRSRASWYSDRGIPYRRGYLFDGPPGSGKSSFIQALAAHFDQNICILNLAERGLTDDKLNHLLVNVPDNSVVLLEDVDSAFNKRTQTSSDGYQSSVTFSGLLNSLDGVASSDSRIVFMTTNHLDRLDQALIRPGRVDLRQTIGDAEPDQACELFERFYADTDDISTQSARLHQLIERSIALGHPFSMASLQGVFIRFDANQAIDELAEQLQQQQQQQQTVLTGKSGS